MAQYRYFAEGQFKVDPTTGTKCRTGQLNHQFVEQKFVGGVWVGIGDSDGVRYGDVAGAGCRFREGMTDDGDYVVDVELEIAGFLLAEGDGWVNCGSVSSYLSALNPTNLTLTSTGNGLGVATLRLRASEDTLLTLGDNAKFYSNIGGTVGESSTVIIGDDTTVYIRCSTGTATLNIPTNTIISWEEWTSVTNAPSIGGDISPMTRLHVTSLTGLSTLICNISKFRLLENFGISNKDIPAQSNFYGDISGLTRLYVCSVFDTGILSGSVNSLLLLKILAVGGSNTLSGNGSVLTLLEWVELFGNNTVTFPTFINIKGLSGFFNDQITWTSENVNQLLADLWANRDEPKPLPDRGIYTRYIDLSGTVDSEGPTGQGIIDKNALEEYKSPNNTGTYRWTIHTRTISKELILNKYFDTDLWWSIVGESTIHDGIATILNTQGTGGHTYISHGVMTIGKNYEVKYEVTAIRTLGAGLLFSTFTSTQVGDTVGLHTFIDIATGANFVIENYWGNTDIDIDNVSIHEVPAP